ncbi:MAG TPA: hypothetical protein VFB50_17490 [Chloroflexota bacterium]|nr:hypothetical protein [Chloroflexota bacterium]
MMDTFSGANYAPFTTSNVAVKARGGRLAKLVVTSAVTGSITIYDNPSAASGNVLFTATTPAVGITVLDIPARSGIYLVPGSAGGGILVYS